MQINSKILYFVRLKGCRQKSCLPGPGPDFLFLLQANKLHLPPDSSALQEFTHHCRQPPVGQRNRGGELLRRAFSLLLPSHFSAGCTGQKAPSQCAHCPAVMGLVPVAKGTGCAFHTHTHRPLLPLPLSCWPTTFTLSPLLVCLPCFLTCLTTSGHQHSLGSSSCCEQTRRGKGALWSTLQGQCPRQLLCLSIPPQEPS